MKAKSEILLLTLVLSFALQVSGQNIVVAHKNTTTNEGNDKREVLDKVKYRITYASKIVADTTKRDSTGDYAYDSDDMRLGAVHATC